MSPFASTGESFEATVFVSSVQGYTKRSAALSPAEVAAWANRFLRDVTDAVLRERGTPVKYLGDALLAYFRDDDHEERALRAAIAARDAGSEQLIIGLASGPVFLAEVGHPEWARPDILGTTVNTAFRILDWVGPNAASRIAIAGLLPHRAADRFERKRHAAVPFKGLPHPLDVTEIATLR